MANNLEQNCWVSEQLINAEGESFSAMQRSRCNVLPTPFAFLPFPTAVPALCLCFYLFVCHFCSAHKALKEVRNILLLDFFSPCLSLSLYACVCVCWLPASAINLQQLKIKLIKIYVRHIFALGLAQRRISVPLETCVKNVLLLLPPVCFTYL